MEFCHTEKVGTLPKSLWFIQTDRDRYGLRLVHT